MFHHSFYSQEKHINNREMCCVSLFFLGHPCNLRMTYKTLLSYVYFHIYIYFLRKLAGNRLIRQNTVNIHMAVLTYFIKWVALVWQGRDELDQMVSEVMENLDTFVLEPAPQVSPRNQ